MYRLIQELTAEVTKLESEIAAAEAERAALLTRNYFGSMNAGERAMVDNLRLAAHEKRIVRNTIASCLLKLTAIFTSNA